VKGGWKYRESFGSENLAALVYMSLAIAEDPQIEDTHREVWEQIEFDGDVVEEPKRRKCFSSSSAGFSHLKPIDYLNAIQLEFEEEERARQSEEEWKFLLED